MTWQDEEERRVESVALIRLRATDFRIFAELDIALDPGFTVLHGENAQGKTSLLEAIHWLSTTRLLRSSRDAEAIRLGTAGTRVEGILDPFSTEIRLELEAGARKRAFLKGIALKRAAEMIGRLPSVSISTLDMTIAQGEPSDRRLMLDLELSQRSAGYLLHLTHYKRALEQRNALLRAARERHIDAMQFLPWETQLAEHGAALRLARRAFIQDLGPHLAANHAHLAPSERLEAHMDERDPADTSEALKAALETLRPSDVQRGSTSVGPHRDDLALSIDGLDVRTFGSQGQQRSTVISFKLATLTHAAREAGFAPILLLDDILSDLDEGRRARLVEWVGHHARQAVLTCTEPSVAGRDILDRATLLRVAKGRVTRE